MSRNGGNSAQNNTVHLKICPLAAAGCCHMSQNVFTENAFFCAQTTQATWYHCSSFLREGPSGQRMNVGRHNNAKISLLNGLVWTRRGRRENRILILCRPGRIAYRFLPLETNLVAIGQSQGREVLL